jgi:hypothetical protein
VKTTTKTREKRGGREKTYDKIIKVKEKLK